MINIHVATTLASVSETKTVTPSWCSSQRLAGRVRALRVGGNCRKAARCALSIWHPQRLDKGQNLGVALVKPMAGEILREASDAELRNKRTTLEPAVNGWVMRIGTYSDGSGDAPVAAVGAEGL